MNNEPTFDFDKANLSDHITVIGTCEHIFEHACKSASTLEKDDAIFYQTLADMTKEFRRNFMKQHFPKVSEQDWCILKATDTLRQRVYESAYTSYNDLKAINELWSTVMEHIFEVDLSNCNACQTEREGDILGEPTEAKSNQDSGRSS